MKKECDHAAKRTIRIMTTEEGQKVKIIRDCCTKCARQIFREAVNA